MKVPNVPQRTTPGFAFSIVERALLECIADRKFGQPEIEKVLAFFGGDPTTCAFCGATPFQRWDHLVSVKKGGDTVLGNIVPACSKCDDSKRNLDFEDWAFGPAPGSPTTRKVYDVSDRVAKIRAYVKQYSYRAKFPRERLTTKEFAEFEQLLDDLHHVRSDMDKFIARYRKRTGLQ